jgi:hypothetical protein
VTRRVPEPYKSRTTHRSIEFFLSGPNFVPQADTCRTTSPLLPAKEASPSLGVVTIVTSTLFLFNPRQELSQSLLHIANQAQHIRRPEVPIPANSTTPGLAAMLIVLRVSL